MSEQLRELYQQVILDHNRKPRNFRSLARPTRVAEGHNPLCGDNVVVQLDMDGDVIRDIAFQGSGCAISKAAASMMTEALKGRTVDEAEEIFRRFQRMVTGDDGAQDAGAGGPVGKLAVFAGVREFPSRVKCATLPWHTSHAALAGERVPVSTE